GVAHPRFELLGAFFRAVRADSANPKLVRNNASPAAKNVVTTPQEAPWLSAYTPPSPIATAHPRNWMARSWPRVPALGSRSAGAAETVIWVPPVLVRHFVPASTYRYAAIPHHARCCTRRSLLDQVPSNRAIP